MTAAQRCAQTRTFILQLFPSFYKTRKTLLRVKKYLYEGEKKITIFYSGDRMDFPSEGCISHDSDRCVQRVRVCVRVCVLRVHGCVKEKFEGTPLHLVSTSTVVESHYPSWALWEFHQCVTSHLFTRLCGLHRVEQSRVSPRRHTADPVTSSGLLFKSLSVCVRTVQGIKLSKLQFSHFHCFASVVHSSAIYIFSPINTATALPTGRELRRGGDLTQL